MTRTKFDGHGNAQAYLITDIANDTEYLQSYDTIVIESKYNPVGKYVRHKINGLYSMTTRKHIGWYAQYQNLAYSHFKWAYEHNCNIIQDCTSNKIMFESCETPEIIDTIKY